MASLAIPQLEPRLNPDREALLARLLPIPHSPESMDGIPYYDEEFAMAQSDAHRKSIYYLGGLLDRVAAVAELEVLEPSTWTAGRKVRVYYQGREFREAQVEEQAREVAEQQAQHAQQAREAAEQQAQQERQARETAERQVEQLLARLKQAGLEP